MSASSTDGDVDLDGYRIHLTYLVLPIAPKMEIYNSGRFSLKDDMDQGNQIKSKAEYVGD